MLLAVKFLHVFFLIMTRVTFVRSDVLLKAKETTGIYLFGLWCNILGGGSLSLLLICSIILLRRMTKLLKTPWMPLGWLSVLNIRLMSEIQRSIRVPVLSLSFLDLMLLYGDLLPSMGIFVEFGTVVSP